MNTKEIFSSTELKDLIALKNNLNKQMSIVKSNKLKRCKIYDFPLRNYNKNSYCTNCWKDCRIIIEEEKCK